MTESICKVDKYGTKWWWLNDHLHREDGPAVEYTNGAKSWYLNGKCHREDGPAIESMNEINFWILNGQFIAKGKRPDNWDELVAFSIVKKVMTE